MDVFIWCLNSSTGGTGKEGVLENHKRKDGTEPGEFPQVKSGGTLSTHFEWTESVNVETEKKKRKELEKVAKYGPDTFIPGL